MRPALRALEQTWDRLGATFDSIGPDDWRRPTPCAEWDVHDIVAHIGAVEGAMQGFEQPDPPEGWSSTHTGLDAFTDAGVVARRDWSHEQVVDEARRAGAAQLARLRDLDEAGWDADTVGPLGPTTVEGAADLRAFDLYTHLLDLRAGLGQPIDAEGAPDAAAVLVARALRSAGWGAVKQAGLADGSRVRLALTGAGGVVRDLVVDGGRGHLVDPDGEPADRVEGPAVAFALLVCGRPEAAEAAGGVRGEGPAGRALVERYRLFG